MKIVYCRDLARHKGQWYEPHECDTWWFEVDASDTWQFVA